MFWAGLRSTNIILAGITSIVDIYVVQDQLL